MTETMDSWKPIEQIISTYEAHLHNEGLLDELAPEIPCKTMREWVEIGLKDDDTGLADFIRRNFDLDEPFSNKQLTGREAIAAIREGTAHGIPYYGLATLHFVD